METLSTQRLQRRGRKTNQSNISTLLEPLSNNSRTVMSQATAGVSARIRHGFNHSFCLRDVAWIRPAYVSTKRGDDGTTSPTVLTRQNPISKQSKYRFVSLQHHSLIIAQTWKGCSWGHFKKGSTTRAWRLRWVRSSSINLRSLVTPYRHPISSIRSSRPGQSMVAQSRYKTA